MNAVGYPSGRTRITSAAGTLLLVLGALSSLGTVAAYGATRTASDLDGDATLTLAVEDTLSLNPPSADWCLVDIEVEGNEVDFTIGDSISIRVYEDDIVGDDLFFETTFVVTASEVSAQRVSRYFDCSTDPINILDGAGDYSEVYAEARVYKDECGTFCRDDQPQTSLIDVLVVEYVSAVPSSATARLRGAYPNPFNPRTTIAFDMPSPEAVSLFVFDVSGRLVEVLLDNAAAREGRNEVVWRGRDMDGRAVPAGVYFYRLTAGSYSETRRMVLLK